MSQRENSMKKNTWIAGVTAVMAASMIIMTPVSARAESVIPAGVYIAGISLEGMTEAEAHKTVNAYVNEKYDQMVTLDINGMQAAVCH